MALWDAQGMVQNIGWCTRPLYEPAEYYAFDFGADGMCLENTALRYFIFLPYSLGRNVGLEK